MDPGYTYWGVAWPSLQFTERLYSLVPRSQDGERPGTHYACANNSQVFMGIVKFTTSTYTLCAHNYMYMSVS